jgi:molybdenum cofactor biosynthesis enzyme MoaA
VRSSPTAPRRELGLARVQRIAREAAGLGVKEIFVTGDEPFLLQDIGEILSSCAAAAPTTVLTNGMLFTGRRTESLQALPRDRIVLQISLDSATPELHDLHRGPGTWERTCEGIQRARAQGFRVRLAATVSTDAETDAFRQFLDEEKIEAEDRVIRRIALRGSANEGVAVSRADLLPEVTRATFFPSPSPSLQFAAPSTALQPLRQEFFRLVLCSASHVDSAGFSGSHVVRDALPGMLCHRHRTLHLLSDTTNLP